MHPGKVSNSILKRSVFKRLKSKNKLISSKPAMGLDCAHINTQGGNVLSCVSYGDFAVFKAANNIASCGGMPVAAQCAVIMPVDFDERVLKDIVSQIDSECAYFGMQISGGRTLVSDKVNEPVVTITGIGIAEADVNVSAANAKPGQDIVMTKHIGISGIRMIAELKKNEIENRYTTEFLEQAVADISDMSVQKEASVALGCGVNAMHDVNEGGIFAALWNMAEAAGAGIDVDCRKITVKQEIIEICEMFDINPYELESAGSLLIAADNGYQLVEKLKENGITAQVIGAFTKGNQRIIRNQDEIRYLDVPKTDEINRFKADILFKEDKE